MPRERSGSLVSVLDVSFGQVVTAVLSAGSGASLAANVEIDPGGHLQAALLDPDGLTDLPGFALADSRLVCRSGLGQLLAWKGRQRLPDHGFRLRLRLTGARLFAVDLNGGTVVSTA